MSTGLGIEYSQRQLQKGLDDAIKTAVVNFIEERGKPQELSPAFTNGVMVAMVGETIALISANRMNHFFGSKGFKPALAFSWYTLVAIGAMCWYMARSVFFESRALFQHIRRNPDWLNKMITQARDYRADGGADEKAQLH